MIRLRNSVPCHSYNDIAITILALCCLCRSVPVDIVAQPAVVVIGVFLIGAAAWADVQIAERKIHLLASLAHTAAVVSAATILLAGGYGVVALIPAYPIIAHSIYRSVISAVRMYATN